MFYPQYTIEWEAYKTLELLSDYDGQLSVKMDKEGRNVLIFLNAETTFLHPDAMQYIRLEAGAVLENIVIGGINGKTPLEHYKKYFARLPDDVKELLKPIL